MRRRLLAPLLVVLALAAAGCDLRLVTPPGTAPQRYRDAIFSTVNKTADITYGSATNQLGNVVTLKLDLYQPAGDTVTARPAIVLVHGGSFTSLSKTSIEIVDEANVYAKEGYVVVSIDYRLSTNGCTSVTTECLISIRDARHDAQAAVRFLRKNAATYGVDTTRIAIGGTSAGAITALEVAYGSDDVGTSGNPGFDSKVRAAVSLSGARILTRPDAGEPAALLFHGTADPLVPYQWALDTVAAAQAVEDYVELTTWEGEGHVPYAVHRTDILTQTSNFLYWTLDLTHAAR